MISKSQEIFWKLSNKIEPHLVRIRILISTMGLGLSLITSNLLQLAIGDPNWNQQATSFLKIGLVIVSVAFLIQILWIFGGVFFGKPIRMRPPPDTNREEYFNASPYARDWRSPTDMEMSRINSLSNVASEEFESDTFKNEVIFSAIKRGCAIGLKLSDKKGRDIGFLDLYHLSPDALKKWIKGSISEKDMKKSDFVPIATALDKGERSLDLIVGAILLNHSNPLYNYYLGPLLVSAFHAYAASALKDFEKVNLYASIYSSSGQRYAELFDFEPCLSAEDRDNASGGHAIYQGVFEPNDPSFNFFANTRHTVFKLKLSI